MDPLFQRFKAQQDNIRDAQRFKGQKPKSRPTRAERLCKFHLLLNLDQERAVASGMNMIKTSVISHIYPPSVASIRDLKPMTIDDLVLETNHRGRYLLLRTISPPDKMLSVCVIVEDVKGVAELLILYNCVDEWHTKFLKEFMPQGSIILLKEPYFKMSSDGDACLRVDHSSDLVFLEQRGRGDNVFGLTWRDWAGAVDLQREMKIPIPNQWGRYDWDGEQKPLEGWKQEGNTHFRMGNFYGALRCYTKGLQATARLNSAETASQITATLRLNRIQALHSLEFHEKAFAECDYFVNAIDECNEKAVYRGARALYFLRRFEDCKNWLDNRLLPHCPIGSEAASLLAKVEIRLKEQRSGQYDFGQLRKVVKRKGVNALSELDAADYQSPAVELRNVENMGRGLVATRDIEPGELLLVSKAWAIGYSEKRGVTMLLNMETKEMCLGSQAAVTEMAIMRTLKSPEQAKKLLFELTSGSYNRVGRTEVDGRLVVDTYLIDRIRALNSFGCSLMSLEKQFEEQGESRMVPGTKLGAKHIDKQTASQEASGHNAGIWIPASYINHSCQSNCSRAFIGDIMIVRATKPIRTNDQLTWGYVFPSDLLNEPDNLEGRQKKLQHWGFKCSCQRCIIEAKDNKVIRVRRQQLYTQITDSASSLRALISGAMLRGDKADLTPQLWASVRRDRLIVHKLIKDLQNTYPASRPAHMFLRIELGFALADVMAAYGLLGPSPEMRDVAKEFLSALGWVVEFPEDSEVKGGHGGKGKLVVATWGTYTPCVLSAWVYFWWESIKYDRVDFAQQYRDVAKKVYTIGCGCEEGFDERFGKDSDGKVLGMLAC